MRLPIVLLVLAITVVVRMSALRAEIPAEIEQFISVHCSDCHNEIESRGGLNFERLGFDLTDGEVARMWVLAHDRVASGEMPPVDASHPAESDKRLFLRSLADAIRTAELSRNDVVLRRLNRHEYQNTVRDLFSIDVLNHGLPEDSATGGFDTVGEGLAVSAEAMQAYLDAADQVLDAVFGPAVKPTFIRHETNLLDQVDWQGRPQLESQIGKMFRRTDDGLVIFQSNYCPTNLVNFARLRAPAGTYRGTIRARAVQSDQPVTLRIYAGDTIVNRRENHLVGYFDVPPGEWTTIEFVDRLVEDGGTFLPKCYGTRDTRSDADSYPEPGIEIGDIVIEGPLEPWPPVSRKLLLGEVDLSSAGVAEASQVIATLLPRAFRRPVTIEETAPYVELFEQAIEAGRNFESALRISLKAILCSPEFLFLEEPGGDTITPHAIATRLAYFLWSSMPDAELMQLADEGTLVAPEILRQQVERLLNSPKSSAFTENFTGQWLDLRDIDFTEPDPNLYPEFDELLRISMVQETRLFFEEILNQNLSLTDFVDSDFTFLNGRLASHYGIDGVTGQAFRRVPLPAESVRGGLLTQASILKVTANGTYTSPVLRGVWILENILGAPTPPPPDNVGSVEPDIRGATTIRDQLARHQEIESCGTCHAKIDPLGFGLESFDPIGGFRTHYRTTAEDARRPEIKQAPFTFEWVRYRIGHPVDAAVQLSNGRTIDTVTELKAELASQPDLIARNLTEKLLTYALGRRLGFSDRDTVEAIVRQSRQDDYRFRSLIHSLVQSPTFKKP